MKKNDNIIRLFFSLRFVPLLLRKAFFHLVFRLFYLVSAKRRLIALQNLRHAFPEKSDEEIIRIAKGVYQNLSIILAEFFNIPFFTPDNIGKVVTVDGKEHYEEALAKHKGILGLASHFSNWEMQAPIGAIYLKTMDIVYRRSDNNVIEDIIIWSRTAHGNRMIPKGSAGQTIRELLQQDNFVGALADQNVDVDSGVFVSFFNRPTCTSVGIAALAIQTGAPVLPAFVVRQSDGRYKLILKPVVEITITDNYEHDLFVNTQHFAKIVEDVIREYPEQWLWLHQRWKTKKCQLPKSNSN